MPDASVTSPHPVTTSADAGVSGYRSSAGSGEIVVPWQITGQGGAPGARDPAAYRSSAEIVVEWRMTGPVFAHAASAQSHPRG
jgi:hypothetical protein